MFVVDQGRLRLSTVSVLIRFTMIARNEEEEAGKRVDMVRKGLLGSVSAQSKEHARRRPLSELIAEVLAGVQFQTAFLMY